MGLRCTLFPTPDWAAEAFAKGERPKFDAGTPLDIDKSWHGLHFLISGSADDGIEPERFLLSGYEWTDVSDHLKTHRYAAVKAFNEIISSLTDEDLRARFDPATMDRLNIYPDDWDEAGLDYLLEYMTLLRPFIAEAAKRGDGMGITIL